MNPKEMFAIKLLFIDLSSSRRILLEYQMMFSEVVSFEIYDYFYHNCLKKVGYLLFKNLTLVRLINKVKFKLFYYIKITTLIV